MLSIPLILLTCNTFAEDIIDELHKESAILVSQERYNEALDVFDQILEIDSENVKALINRSAVLTIIGENELAISDTNQILSIEPNNVKALTNKGTALAKIGYTYDAISIFESALEIEPDNQKLIDGRNFLFQFIDLLDTNTNEKYEVYVHAQVRTPQDELILVIESAMTEYLPSNITDDVLNRYPVIEIIEKNDKKYEVRQITHRTDEPNHKAYGHLRLHTMCDDVPGCLNIFAGRTAAIVVDGGDYVITQWTIHRIIE